jgi:hypothetical protein
VSRKFVEQKPRHEDPILRWPPCQVALATAAMLVAGATTTGVKIDKGYRFDGGNR